MIHKKINENLAINEDVLLGPEDIERLAVEIAKSQEAVEKRRVPKWLIGQINDNYKSIYEVYKQINRDTEGKAPGSATNEWLLDNFYIIEEQVKDIKSSLSKNLRAPMPLLKNQPMKGFPRIYALAVEFVNHTDGMIDENNLVNFLRAYQSQQPLTMCELWAIAVMLRIALIEKIGRICGELKVYLKQRKLAEKTAELVISEIDYEGVKVRQIIYEAMGDQVYPSFVEALVQKLRKHGRRAASAISYIDGIVMDLQQVSMERLVSIELQAQAARQVSIGNAITGLRMIVAVDWNDVFESLSCVEQIMRQDPSGIYHQMDFESRDHYRHIVERISQFYDVSEIVVANKAIQYAREAIQEDGRETVNHVGYYLIDAGKKNLEKEIGIKPRCFNQSIVFLKERPHLVYFGSIVLITMALMSLFLEYTINEGLVSPLGIILVGFLILVPASDIAINSVNSIVSSVYSPTVLPKLELKSGVSEENSTLVVIPTLLPNAKRVKDLLQRLEVYYLANKEDNLYFALAGDFKDAAAKDSAEDHKIIKAAVDGINELNRRYSRKKTLFYSFLRERSFDKSQKQWLGWERKRGAIVELNDLLSGAADTAYTILSSPLAELPAVKYVITLDADTNLPTGTAKRLIGTMMHPLNKPVIDREKGIVIKGYGILQPRIGVSLESANKTIFSRVFAGQGGIDPYTTAVSDVYQDLFGEGIFVGKGIYELSTFQTLLKAIPENCVLSHDLLEGSYIRAGLVTDIELIDGYPARYNSFSSRLHRWVRGDWQLFPWLASRVKNSQGQSCKNPLTMLSRWKIIDNLRRSVLNPILFVLIVMGFTILPGSSLVWLGLVVVTISFPTITYLLGGVLANQYPLMEGAKGQTVISGVRASLYQAGIQFIFIAYQAYLMTDAITRTVARIFITKRNLLEWIPAADLEALMKNNVRTYFKKMWISPVLGLLLLGMAFIGSKTALDIVLLVLIAFLWIVAPYVAHKISRIYLKKFEQLPEPERTELRRLARKTWAYFEDMVTPEENYLPPDNYQVDPPNGIAHRTSPTNIGLLLVSTLAARDFGYMGTVEMLERCNSTLITIENLEKWEGHLYNWYDTVNLKVLRPRYVSTVDSGNFVGYLMVLEQGLLEYIDRPAFDLALAQGLLDTIHIYNEETNDTALICNTDTIEAFLKKGEPQSSMWLEVLKDIETQLTQKGQGLEEGTDRPLWGRKILYMIASFRKEEMSSGEFIRERCQALLIKVRMLIENTKFVPLFNSKRQLFSIGYNVEEGLLTKSFYDLLASEARLASYIAIARGEVEVKHWFRLGRKLTQVDGYKGLVSWSGTMFEYFMPLLIMRNYENSLLDMTYKFVVNAQKKYGMLRNVPWGVSESAYFAFDIALSYQYKAFGIPEIGLKRGLGSEVVIAPYATILALNTDPKGVSKNLSRLKEEGMDGIYGLYEAKDFTPSRVSVYGQSRIIKNFMAHHQGMSILALNNFFYDNTMQRRFHNNPVIKSAEVILEERMPQKAVISKEEGEDYKPLKKKKPDEPEVIRRYGVPRAEIPNVQLLSNGSYTVMITDGGSGYSRNNNIAVSRWSETRRTSSGFFIYIQNINSNNVWSAAFEPYNATPEEYSAVFSPSKAEFIRKDGNITTHTQIVVSPEDNTEVRKITLTNNGQSYRVMEVTSYLETVLTHPEADLAHPAFSNLFVTTEFVPEADCLLAQRRPRSINQKPVWVMHTLTVEGEVVGNLQYETDRAKFIGRNRGLNNPLAMDVDRPLSNTTGAVLDPIMSLRRRVRIEPGHSVRVSYSVAIADDRRGALILADKYHNSKVIERAFEFAWNRSQIEAGHLGITPLDMEVFQNMIPSILFPGPARRKYEEIIFKNKKGQPCLWPFGISGDIPLIAASINDLGQIALVYQLLKAHEFWRMKGLILDLVFLVEDDSGYVQPLQDSIKEAIFTSHARELAGVSGGVFLINANLMAEEEKNLIYAVARIILKGEEGSISEQLIYNPAKTVIPNLILSDTGQRKSGQKPSVPVGSAVSASSKLLFDNGIGGFSPDGTEYVIHLRQGQHTPAPWINVIANERFGFNITEVGAGYTWAENSRENKLTPWYNDPVTDLLGEVFYLRDEHSGEYWSITPMPIREKEEYVIRHGAGYSCFEHDSHGLAQRLIEFVALEDTVKISLIGVTNLSQVTRELSLTFYMLPVLGVNEKVNGQYITTSSYGHKRVLLINNFYNCDFPGRIVFIDSSEEKRTFTGDGHEFIGTNRTLEEPAAMKRESLSDTVGAGLVPCGAMQIKISLKPEETKDIVFVLGQAEDLSGVDKLTEKFGNVAAARSELIRIKNLWAEKLEVIQVSTPNKAMDILLNRWLQYQVISCRLWSRAAFYQSGGAYGFRDQLQDVMAVAYSWPELTRKQILLHSAHQFLEGDVQHWWHPGVNKGIRTRYSDDFLWLPYVTADYIQCTGDWSVLEEETGFLEDEPLPVHEDERYIIPRISEERGSIYDHCLRAIDNALKFGEHGIPLMGSGDWNDGMNTVGNKGRGESVWLGWFLCTVLLRFIPICRARKDEQRAEKYLEIVNKVTDAIERNAWDGSWYRRAYFDDGKPLGSAENAECKIDAIAQSWSVISGLGKPLRAKEALEAVDNYLIDREAGIIKLLEPPFENGDLQPGYIKGYGPGVRENGGQYTHAAVWTILAFAKLGQGDKAGELFDLINPINHTRTLMNCMRYKVEPYVVAADVYAVSPNTGRGGWSWYTGAAGWMYRVGLESIIGLKKVGSDLHFDPCVPKVWQEFKIQYKLSKTLYKIHVRNPEKVSHGVKRVLVNGHEVSQGYITLKDDGKEYNVEVIMGKTSEKEKKSVK